MWNPGHGKSPELLYLHILQAQNKDLCFWSAVLEQPVWLEPSIGDNKMICLEPYKRDTTEIYVSS